MRRSHSPLTQTIGNLLGQSSDHWFYKIISDIVLLTFMFDGRVTISSCLSGYNRFLRVIGGGGQDEAPQPTLAPSITC